MDTKELDAIRALREGNTPLISLVRRFAGALLAKMQAACEKYGYTEDGWMASDWQNECHNEMLRHIDKGDPRDVAAYCAFMWYHGWGTRPNPSLLEGVQALRAIPSWIPVTERLPETMKPVLVMRKSGEQSVAWLGITQSGPVKPWFWGGYQSAIEATHWMELPAPPSQEKGDPS